jgi:hypothetical protein
MRDMKIAYKILVGKPDEKRPLGKPRRRWDDSIKTVPGGENVKISGPDLF